MKKNNYVKVRDNKNDILFLTTNRRNLIKEGKYYDLFDQIFESISKRNYISVFDFLIDSVRDGRHNVKHRNTNKQTNKGTIKW